MTSNLYLQLSLLCFQIAKPKMQTWFCNDFRNYSIHNFTLVCIVLIYTHVIIFVWNIINAENVYI